MRPARDIDLRREIATALAVLAMVLQVVFSPILIERHAYTVETDYGLSILCGHPDPSSADDPAAPASDHQSHDCPCCQAIGGHVVLPEPAAFALPQQAFAHVDAPGPVDAQVMDVATVSDTQLPRAPPRIG